MRWTLTILLLAPTLKADDWPQWMGPNRDNVWKESGLPDRFPAGGPKVLWRAPVGGGYAGPAVAAGRVFVSDYARTQGSTDEGNFQRKPTEGTETLMAFDAATGKPLWQHSYPVKYTISYPAGPRCTPLVSGDLVYFLGAEGNLVACDVATGTVKWQKALKAEYKTTSALWGYAAHPLLDGDNLITLAGGEGSHVVALDKATGAEVWRSQTQPEQGYCPPLVTTAGGVRQLIVPGPTAVRGLDPATGRQLWSTRYDATNGSVIMTPVRVGDYLFVGGYQGKNLLLKLLPDRPGVEVVWKDKPRAGLSPVNVQPIADGTTVYGFHESGALMAVDIPSGNRLWTSTAPIVEDKELGTGTAFLVRAGDKYVLFNELGELVLCKLSPKGYEELSRAKVIEPTGTAFGRKVVWCMPAFADKRCYVRNDKEIICVNLAVQ
jgi:outer membrane protein assembly factor BamB